MGSEFGYKYEYTFSMMDEDEIQPKQKSVKQHHGHKTFLFDIRTNFQLVQRDVEEPVLIDSERFNVSIDEAKCRPEIFTGRGIPGPEWSLVHEIKDRLYDYWMTLTDIRTFCTAAIDFAKQMGACPQNTSLGLIPVVVSFQVCTVQREGESYDSTMERAICSEKLIPLYLWENLTINADEGSKPIDIELKQRLRSKRRYRNEKIFDPDWICFFCSRRPSVETQISILECRHVFHSLCVTRHLEEDNSCPICDLKEP